MLIYSQIKPCSKINLVIIVLIKLKELQNMQFYVNSSQLILIYTWFLTSSKSMHELRKTNFALKPILQREISECTSIEGVH